MRTLLFLLSATLLAACSPAAPVTMPDGHPASTATTPAAYAVDVSALAPAPQPDLPAALRPDGRAPGMEGMDHDAMIPDDVATPSGLSDALDAYLSVQTALAADRLDGVSRQARTLDASIAVLAETPPEDDPHFWHERADDLVAIRTAAADLADADDLARARVAFGHLSAPFAEIAAALGLPDDVTRFRCGMFDEAPDGGVWLQRGDDTRNPYFGTAMLTCGTRQDAPGGGGDGNHSHP